MLNNARIAVVCGMVGMLFQPLQADNRPNIFIAISDDVSYPHASAYGSRMVSTPAFDRIAAAGVLFNNAFCPAPGCSPSRAAFLTGRHIWMIEEAGTHASYFRTKYRTFPERLADAGYFVGTTGKAWAPGDFRKPGRTQNPAGPSFSSSGGNVGGFRKFLQQRPQDQPFCFWFGGRDAHRPYKKGTGRQKGKTLEQAEVPAFLPDHPEIRSDLLDYAFEVERFDDDCDQMLKMLEAAGELENTLIILTSDNGMPFPRAKANCYEFGIHMPLAVAWPRQIPSGRTLDDLVSFVDLTATIYEAAEVDPPPDHPVVGRSLLPELRSEKEGLVSADRDAVFSGRERHSSSRFNTLSYPQRAIRTDSFLYIHNFRPERWPAGAPMKFDSVVYGPDRDVQSGTPGSAHGGYHDIDACPSLTFLIEHRDHPEFGRYLNWSVQHRPADELFDIRQDPACLHNLAADPKYSEVLNRLKERLMTELRKTADARVLDGGDVWETYPRVSSLRWFPAPDWARRDPAAVPKQEWLDARRPRQ
ncbi:MAG: sulfatase [Fuerstiella sp.]